MDEKAKASLIVMYGILREQEDVIYSLMALIAPLVKCLGQYDPRLADLYSTAAKGAEGAIFQKRNDGFAAIDEAVRRLKENSGR